MKNREFLATTLALLSAVWLASCGGNQGSGTGIATIDRFDSQLFSSLSTPASNIATEAAS
jgi:hypothetical protein